MSRPQSHELLKQYQDGQAEAAAAIFDRYIERLIALARSRIAPRLRRRIDPEDVVQSAYRSFFIHAKNQEYQLARAGDLWRLLASTTLNKLYGQIEKHTAERRSIDREVTEASVILKTHDPAVVDVIAVGEQLRLIVEKLSPDERTVLTSTLQGQTIEEISASIGKSERTVRRLLAQARQQFEQRLLSTKAHAAATPAQVREPHAPLKFSDYVLQRLLGSGGMGKVYRATEKRSGKPVAIKALHKSRQADERAVALFVQESQILATLRHPNIVGVQGLGRFPAGGYFIVMDFVDGLDLQSRLDKGPLPMGEALRIMRQVSSAIQYAHDRNIVHCDLKPANVLVDSSSQAIVTDFGFAFMLADVPRKKTATIGGTAGYIAPEVLAGKSQPTRAADIFALGVLLWTLATGKAPTACDSLTTDNDELMALKGFCSRCWAPNPSQRYEKVADLLAALHTLNSD